MSDLPVISFPGQKAWAAWLGKNHGVSIGVWIEFAKKAAKVGSITYQEAVEVALCYGWIDSLTKSGGPLSYRQKFTPRGPRSIWSKINRGKAERLIASGQMKPAGLRAVEGARADGRWARAYDSWSTAAVPPDLEAALAENARARKFFDGLDRRNQYPILFRLANAKKAETRAKRLGQFVTMLAKGEKIHD